VLVVGCGYRRIADATCSAATLRRRRDEWITVGVAERMRLAVAAYDRMLGLESENISGDGCTTKAPWRPGCRAQADRPPQSRGSSAR
jgi:hypothetical protein